MLDTKILKTIVKLVITGKGITSDLAFYGIVKAVVIKLPKCICENVGVALLVFLFVNGSMKIYCKM